MQCEYCAKFGKDNLLEYIPAKKLYYCKQCENRFNEDDVNTRAGGFPLTVVKEDVAKEVKKIYKTSVKKK